MAEKLKSDDVKATLGDYIKLVQLQKELGEDEQPREIRVTWIEPSGMEEAGVMDEVAAEQTPPGSPGAAATEEKSENEQ